MALQDCELNELKTTVQQLQRQSQDQFVANGFNSAGMFEYDAMYSSRYKTSEKSRELRANQISSTRDQVYKKKQILIKILVITELRDSKSTLMHYRAKNLSIGKNWNKPVARGVVANFGQATWRCHYSYGRLFMFIMPTP